MKTTTLHQAAIALGEEAKRRAAEPLFTTPLLIEGKHTNGRELRITLPTGAVWLYDLPLEDRIPVMAADGRDSGLSKAAPERTVLVNLHLTAPKNAGVYQPTAEGIHPFLGVATRIGVERGAQS